MTTYGITYRLRGYMKIEADDENTAMDIFGAQTVAELLAVCGFQMVEFEKVSED